MEVERSESLQIRTSEDVVRVRQAVRVCATKLGFSLVDQTKIVTAASEIARNAIDHAGGGAVRIESVAYKGRRGVRLEFEDNGPGIADLKQAMTDGFTTGGGLGLGLSGARRLSNEFNIETVVGVGTKVALIRWK